MRAPSLCTVLLAATMIAAPARAQEPAWDAGRHVIVIPSALDSADVAPVVVRALEAEGLVVEHPDTARGRIICAPRASDTYGSTQATVQYLALVHRLPHGGSEIWMGAILHTPALAGDPSSFARVPASVANRTRPEGDFIFVSPRGGGTEWQRLQRIAEAIARAGR